MASSIDPGKTARPARKRAPAAAKVAVKSEAVDAVEDDNSSRSDTTRVTFAMTQGDETKGYAKFSPPASSGCVGTLYVPKGTQVVKVLLEGPSE